MLKICVKHANVKMLVYKMQVRLRESLWSIKAYGDTLVF